MRLLLLIAVVLLLIDALYHDGSNTQAAQRQLSAAVASLIATTSRELELTAEREPEAAGADEESRSGG